MATPSGWSGAEVRTTCVIVTIRLVHASCELSGSQDRELYVVVITPPMT